MPAVTRRSCSRTVRAGVPFAFVAEVRESERRLLGGAALAPYLTHAQNVLRFAAAAAEARLSIKASFTAAGLDYQLARHAVWLAETVERLGPEYPEVKSMGPSFVLLLREAERRLARESRSHELRNVVAAVAEGMPRREVRERFLPPAGLSGPARVLQELKAGRTEAARRTFAACAPEERDALRRLAHALVRVVDAPAGERASRVRALPASLEAALQEVLLAEPAGDSE